jgi:DNA repair photolyase
MIISASRRTDIPAFFSKWFIERVRAGFLLTRNPFNAHQIKRVSLSPEDVDAIVFWTRNPKKMMPDLRELDDVGLKYCFLYTITGYPRALEKNVPNPHEAIETFKELSGCIGSEKVVWRYDPVLVSSLVDIDEHKRLFGKISSSLRGKTERVIVSFADIYKKVERNLNAFSKNNNVEIQDIVKFEDELKSLALSFSKIAELNGMEIQTCAEEIDLGEQGVKHGKCIDDLWLNQTFKCQYSKAKDKGQRDGCGCVKSTDIGAYNTCLHGCEYCYATYSQKSVKNNHQKHDPFSPFLIGSAEGVDEALLQKKIDSQLSLL